MDTPAADTPSMYQLLVLVDPVSLAGSNRIGFPFGLNPVAQVVSAFLCVGRFSFS